MSTISDWAADYGGADTNDPPASTPIPYPVVNDGNGLAEKIRDIKSVIKAESQNKGWEPDAIAATRVSSSVFTIGTDIRELYPVGIAIKLDLGSTEEVVYLTEIDGTGMELTVSPASVAVGLTHVTFSSIKPKSTPLRSAYGYPKNVGSPLPNRISQRARFQISESTVTVSVPFMRTERSDDYELLLQAVDDDGGMAPNGAYRVIDVTKTATGFSMTIDAAPGAGVTMFWEYLVAWGL